MARDYDDQIPVTDVRMLTAWLADGVKDEAELKVGVEHEKFLFFTEDHRPVPYEGQHGIQEILSRLQERTGWSAIKDDQNLIGLFDPESGAAVSIEPGGQFELSGAPLATLHETRDEFDRHIALVNAIVHEMGIACLAVGTAPSWSLDQAPFMPKRRYAIMRDHMRAINSPQGLRMMQMTATVQANFDFTSERDMVKKMRLSLALQPIGTALFANSPFYEGRPSAFLSYRSNVWLETDEDRTGMLDFVWEDGFGFARYSDYLLDVPMYFIKRGDVYHATRGATFRDFLEGKIAGFPRGSAYLSDWINHVGAVFPEVRLKRYLEMRGGDMGGRAHVLAFSAFWTGLLYDESARARAKDLTNGWTPADLNALRRDVPRLGLDAVIGERRVREIAREVVAAARVGLEKRALRDAEGKDERTYLDALFPESEALRSPAEKLLNAFHGSWSGSVTPIFDEHRL